MPLSSTVQVWSINGADIRRQLITAAEHLLTARPEVRRVLLFGSLARGDYAPGSDADIILVLDTSSLPIRERILIYMGYFLPIDIPCDIFPYTEEEIESRVTAGDPFMRHILAEAVDLAGHPSPPSSSP